MYATSIYNLVNIDARFRYKNTISFSKVYGGQGNLLGYQMFPS